MKTEGLDHRRQAGIGPAWIAWLVAGIGIYLMLRIAFVWSADSTLLGPLALVGAVVPPVTVWALAYDRGHRAIRQHVLVAVALTGGVIGVALATTLEALALEHGNGSPLLTAAIEEPTKLLAPAALWLLWRRRHHTARLTGGRHVGIGAGLAVGIASATGFGALETFGDAITLMQHHANVAELDHLLLIRGVLAPARHVDWTGLAALALWRIDTTSRPAALRTTTTAAFALVSVTGLHALWDAPGQPATHAAVATISLGALLTAINHTRRQQGPHTHA